MSGDLANLGALIAVVLSLWLGKNAGENDCGGGKSKEPDGPVAQPEDSGF